MQSVFLLVAVAHTVVAFKALPWLALSSRLHLSNNSSDTFIIPPISYSYGQNNFGMIYLIPYYIMYGDMQATSWAILRQTLTSKGSSVLSNE